MTRTRVFSTIAAILCLLSLGATGARGQLGVPPPEWEYVGSLGDKYHPVPLYSYTATYFFGPLNGVAAISYKGFVTIYWLAPNVQTMGLWKVAAIPSGISYIRRFRFIQGKLYAASSGTDVLVSLDSGKTWAYSGLGLVDANDVYADGSGIIRALHDPMKVFARLDTMHCIAQGDATIFVSSDGGLNWVSSGVPMVDSFSKGAFADRCHNVYVCPNSWGTAFRSTDFGQTWQTTITGSGTGSEFLDGASTVIYITDTLGMFRSTDDGLTWNSVITVDSGACLPIFVFGPMGEHVVIACVVHIPGVGDFDVLLMTTTGGLDDLHSAPSMTDSNGAPLLQQDTLNVPLELASTCQPFLTPITVESDVDSMTVRLTMADSLGDFALAASDSTLALRKGHEDTVWMLYDPHHAVANAVLTFENHWHCSDWTETRTVHVDAIPAALIKPPPILAASCIPDTEAALVRLDSCQSLCIDSVVVPQYLAGNLKLTTHLPDTVSAGRNDSLLLAFTALGTPGTVIDSIIVYGHYLGLDSILPDYFYFPHAWGNDTNFSFFYTSVPITLRTLSSTNVLSTKDSAISLGSLLICQQVDTFAVVRNIGCDSLCVDSASLLGTGFSIIRGAGPACLAPGERDTIWVASQADTTGHTAANTATLTVHSNGNSQLAPIVLSRQIGYPVPWELTLSPLDSAAAGQGVTYQIIQHGVLPADVSSVDFDLVFKDDLLKLNGVDEGWISVAGHYRSPDGLAHYLLHVSPIPQDSIVATLHFTAYQSSELATELSLDSLQLTSSMGRPRDCIASVSTSQTSFSLVSQCGTPELTSFLKSGLIEIDNIDPNPATGLAFVSVSSNAGIPVSAELSTTDALGRTMGRERVVIANGNNRVPLDVTKLASGCYTVRLSAGGLSSIKEFVKE